MTPNDLPLPAIDAAEQAFAAERWASTRVRLMYAIAAALDALREELARPEPFAWATFDGEQSYDLRLYGENEDYCKEYIKRNGEKYATWVMPLYASPQPTQVPDGWRRAVALAYGHLWHVNNEPLAPVPLRSNETAAYAARKLLRDLLTDVERGLAINEVQTMLVAALHPKEKS